MSKQPSTVQTTQQSNTQVAPFVSDAQQGLLSYGNNVFGGFMGASPNYGVAGLNADQTAAYDLTRGMAQDAFTGGATPAAAIAMGRAFDGGKYLQAHPDVAASGMNPLQHYLQFGAAEGRGVPSTTTNNTPLLDFRQNQGVWQAPQTAVAATTTPANAQGYAANGYSAYGYNPATYSGQGYDAKAYDAQGYDAKTYGAQGYDAKSYAGQGYDAKTYDPAMAQAAQVDGAQIHALLNPYTQDVVDTTNATLRRNYNTTAAGMGAKAAAAGAYGGSRQAVQSAQLDRSFGEQVATNTSKLMADGYDKATATAMANAQMRQQVALGNQSAANTAGQVNTGAQNAASQFTAGAMNTAGQINTAAQNAANQFTAGAMNTAGQTNTAAQNAAGQFLAGAQNTAGQVNSAAQNTANQFTAGVMNTAGQYNAGSVNSAGQFGAQANNTAAQYNAGAQNSADQFGAQAGNAVSLANSQASNAASLANAGAQNTRDQNNATAGAAQLQNYNSNALQQQQLDQAKAQLDNNYALALANLQEAMRTNDQARKTQATQALIAIGNAQQQLLQNAINVPAGAVQQYGAIVPGQYASTTNGTSTAPNTAPGIGQQLLGGALTLGGSFLGGPGGAVAGKALGGLFTCDARLKKDIAPHGVSVTGRPLFAFRYKWEPDDAPLTIGPMAQIEEAHDPDSVVELLGIKMVKVH